MSSVNDTQDIASSVIICNAVLIPLSTICIAVRFYTRFCVTRSHGWDDRKYPHLGTSAGGDRKSMSDVQ
jgi:hypothetical protein